MKAIAPKIYLESFLFLFTFISVKKKIMWRSSVSVRSSCWVQCCFQTCLRLVSLGIYYQLCKLNVDGLSTGDSARIITCGYLSINELWVQKYNCSRCCFSITSIPRKVFILDLLPVPVYSVNLCFFVFQVFLIWFSYLLLICVFNYCL